MTSQCNDAMKSFLTPGEKKKIQKSFTAFIGTAKAETLINVFYVENLITDSEKHKLEVAPHGKAEFLFHNVLMKSTYPQIKILRRLLFDNGHKEYATLLPRRTDDEEDLDILDFGQNHKSNTPSDAPPYQTSAPGGHTVKSAAHGDSTQYIGTDDKPQPQNAGKLTSGSITRHYGVKHPKAGAHGCGYVLIIANFTGDLTGYKKDVERIETFFYEKLKFAPDKIRKLENVKKEKMIEELKDLQKEFKKQSAAEHFDRLFVFVLSHGDKQGILTCADDKGIEPEKDKDGESLCQVTVDEIVDIFTHDEVPSLKDYPKCFIIQACQGEEIARHASTPSLKNYTPARKITVGADVLIYNAAQKNKRAYVPDHGSWLIQSVINSFEKYYETDDVLSMLTEVNYEISGMKCTAERDDGKRQFGRQMSNIVSTLTKKFYLKVPDNAGA